MPLLYLNLNHKKFHEMNDQFLINFALTTLVAISFTLQHGAQITFRRMKKEFPKDKNAMFVLAIAVLQMLSIAIIIEVLRYAYSK
jgi:uncharacterized membrane protein